MVLQMSLEVLQGESGVQLHCGLCHHLFGVPPGSWMVVSCAHCGAPNHVPSPTPPTPQAQPGAGHVVVPAGVLPGQQVKLAGPVGQPVVAATVPPGVFSRPIFRVNLPAPTQPAPAPTQPAPEQVLTEDLLGSPRSVVLWKDLLGGPRAGGRTAPAPKRAAPPGTAPPRAKRAFTSPYNEFCKEQRPLVPAGTNNRNRESILGELAPYSLNPNPSLQLALTLARAV